VFYEGVGDLYKVEVPFDDNKFAVVNATHLLYYQQGDSVGVVVEVYQTEARTFALSTTRLLYQDTNNMINADDECQEGEFYDAGQCYPCSG